MRTVIISTANPTRPLIVPVLDLKGGQAVHAVGGDRRHYRPVRSALHPGSDPVSLARAFRDRLGLRALYLADLDAIAGAPPALATYREIASLAIDLWVDAGLRTVETAECLVECGVSTIIAASETLNGPAALDSLIARIGSNRIVFGLDLKAGRPLLALEANWGHTEPTAIAALAVHRGVRRLLLLDLARVGSGTGLGTLPLLRELSLVEHAEIAVGGGISRADEVSAAARAGASAVLLGSALHTGAIRIVDGEVVDGPPR